MHPAILRLAGKGGGVQKECREKPHSSEGDRSSHSSIHLRRGGDDDDGIVILPPFRKRARPPSRRGRRRRDEDARGNPRLRGGDEGGAIAGCEIARRGGVLDCAQHRRHCRPFRNDAPHILISCPFGASEWGTRPSSARIVCWSVDAPLPPRAPQHPKSGGRRTANSDDDDASRRDGASLCPRTLRRGQQLEERLARHLGWGD